MIVNKKTHLSNNKLAFFPRNLCIVVEPSDQTRMMLFSDVSKLQNRSREHSAIFKLKGSSWTYTERYR